MMLLDHSQGLADEVVLKERQEMLETAPAIGPLKEWVAGLNARRTEETPNFDPASGGVCARAMFLHSTPSLEASAGEGTGFMSVDNPDDAAANMWQFQVDAGISQADTVQWNIIPWYRGVSPDVLSADDLRAGGRELRAALANFHRLQVIILCGADAQRGWKDHAAQYLGDKYVTINAPSVGKRAMNRAPLRAKMAEELNRAAGLLGPPRKCYTHSAEGH